MRKQLLTATLAILMVVVLGASAQAEIPDANVDESMSVTATATIDPDIGLSIAPASIVFGTTNADAFPTTPADGKIVITYKSNYNPWKLAIYTNNIQVPNFDNGGTPDDVTDDTGRYAKGGLATGDGASVVACKWVCQDDATPAPSVPAYGDYNFIKDLRDEDDPSTTGDDEDESWATAFAGGYANIAYGGGGKAFCIDPTVGDPYQGEPADGSIAVYIAGLFATNGMDPAAPASPGNYSSSIYFDLYHE